MNMYEIYAIYCYFTKGSNNRVAVKYNEVRCNKSGNEIRVILPNIMIPLENIYIYSCITLKPDKYNHTFFMPDPEALEWCEFIENDGWFRNTITSLYYKLLRYLGILPIK